MIGLSFSFDYVHAYNWSLERLQFCFFSSLAVLALRYLGINVGFTLLRDHHSEIVYTGCLGANKQRLLVH